MNRDDLYKRLRSDSNGVPLKDIPPSLDELVSFLVTCNLAHIQKDEGVFKPNPIFFNSPDRLTSKLPFPMGVLEACGHGPNAQTMVTSGKARFTDDPIAGLLVVVN